MGKKGNELRAKKANTVTYTFTAAQLTEHDNQVRKDFVEEYRKTFKREAAKVADALQQSVRDEWKARAEEFASGGNDDFYAYMKYLLAAPCKVLIEQFGWSPPPKNAKGEHYRIVRFGNAIIDEIEKVSNDDTLDIRAYAKDVEEKYRISFIKGEENEN